DFFFQAEDGIRDDLVTGVQTCALPILNCTFAPPIVYTLHWASAVPELSIDDAVVALLTNLRKHERYRHRFGRVRTSSDTATLVVGDFTMGLCPRRLKAPDRCRRGLHPRRCMDVEIGGRC